jgi:ATP-dependent RNA helicase DeaD
MTTLRDSGLKPEILKAVEELGFEELMPVQEKVIPAILASDSDLVGLAQTGTGKTAAFGLPLLHKMDENLNKPQIIIMTPTRELCMQVASDFESFAKYLNNIRIVAVYGGASIDRQIGSIKRGVQVIVATPGRLLDLIERKCIDFKSINTVILDEADEMLNMGFREDIESILEVIPKHRRTLMFSATMSKEIAGIAAKFMHEPLEIVIGGRNEGAENVHHICYVVSAHDRYLVLKRVIDVFPGMYALIFCRTREETKKIAEKLIKDGYNADALHGDLSQPQRDMAMQKFRLKNTNFLVATDVAARGLDVNDLTHVVNYNLPDEIEAYTHRSGRTGRAGKEGISVILISSREYGKIRIIEKMINKKIEKKNIPGGKEVCEKQLFTFISKIEKAETDSVSIEPYIEVINKKLAWLSKEDLIARVVNLELKRLLAYYEDAPDLNPPEGRSRDQKNDRGNERGSERGSRRMFDENYTRFFVNFGEMDGLSAAELIGMIKDATGDRHVEVGRIDIMQKFSFFECPAEESEKVLKSFDGASHNGRRLVVDLAQPSDRSGSSRSGSRDGGNFRKRERSHSDKGGSSYSGNRDGGKFRKFGGGSRPEKRDSGFSGKKDSGKFKKQDRPKSESKGGSKSRERNLYKRRD